MKTKPAILSIAGYDPTGGAGVILDSAVFRQFGFHPAAVLTSIAAQGSEGVAQVQALPGDFIRRALEIVHRDFDLSAVKIGMLYSVAALQAVSEFVAGLNLPVVHDPVLKASGGGDLLEAEGVSILREAFSNLVTLLTPNIPEAEELVGRRLQTAEACAEAAQEIAENWGTAVLLKGGHLPGDPVDVLYTDGATYLYRHQRIPGGTSIRGTGCALSSALAVHLARGLAIREAVEGAITWLEDRLKGGYRSGRGDVGFLDV